MLVISLKWWQRLDVLLGLLSDALLKQYVYDCLIHFPRGSDNKESAYSVGDPGSIPGSGTSPGEGHGNPLQYSCLEDSMDRGAWLVHGVTTVRHNWVTNTFTFSRKAVSVWHLHLSILIPVWWVFSLFCMIVVHTETFWEGVHRFHLTVLGLQTQKMIINPWTSLHKPRRSWDRQWLSCLAAVWREIRWEDLQAASWRLTGSEKVPKESGGRGMMSGPGWGQAYLWHQLTLPC